MGQYVRGGSNPEKKGENKFLKEFERMSKSMTNFLIAFIVAMILSAVMAVVSYKLCKVLGFNFYYFRDYIAAMTIGLTYFISKAL